MEISIPSTEIAYLLSLGDNCRFARLGHLGAHTALAVFDAHARPTSDHIGRPALEELVSLSYQLVEHRLFGHVAESNVEQQADSCRMAPVMMLSVDVRV